MLLPLGLTDTFCLQMLAATTDAGIVGGLALAMDANQRFKKPPEVLIREREAEQTWDMTS